MWQMEYLDNMDPEKKELALEWNMSVPFLLFLFVLYSVLDIFPK